MRSKLTTMLPGIALVLAIGMGTSPAIAQPVSAGQLAAWQSQRAGLQSQQQSAQAEVAQLQQAYDSTIDPLKNTEAFMVQQGATSAFQALNPNENRTLQERGIDNTFNAMAHRAELGGQLRRAQANLQNITNQLAQLDRQIAYYSNPLQGDLANERARLKILQGQKPTSDDAGQLGWDIANTRRRIDELEGQFQGGGSASGGSSSGQSQGAYGAPTANAGTGSPSQSGYGAGPYYGAPPSGGSSMPNYQDLQRGMPPQGGMAPQTHGGSSGGAPGPNCHQRPDGGGWHCK